MRFTEADTTDEYMSWLNDPLVVRLSNEHFISQDRGDSRFGGSERRPNLMLSVYRLTDEKLIGIITARIEFQHGTADLGIMIGDRSVWRHGYGQDAWNTASNFLAALDGMRKLTTETLAENEAVIRMAEHSGMELEGRLKRQQLVDGEPMDVLLFARLTT